MGNCCQASATQDQLKGLEDLPETNISLLYDPLTRFEKIYIPLHRIHIQGFFDKLDSMGKDQFTLNEMQEIFQTPTFKGKLNITNPLGQILNDLPNSENSSNEVKISILSLQCIGFLLCGGDNQSKAFALFRMLNPPGQNPDSISANDKDWPLILNNLFEVATIFLIRQAVKFDNYKAQDSLTKSVVSNKLDIVRKAIRAMRTMEDNKSEGIISLIFGPESKLSKQRFFEQLNKQECDWIYNPSLIRSRMNEKFLIPGGLDNFYDEEEENQ